jgi:DNA-directed RNA polymerase subunit M/transcription elongation factor TFIIS
MKFCSVCNNMLYIKMSSGDDSNTIKYYCRNCGYEDDTVEREGVCVLKTQLKKNTQKFNHIINRYTKLDPTLPRIYTIRCPNEACTTNTENHEHPEIIYMRYDDENMKYLYLCVTCDMTWKTDDSK